MPSQRVATYDLAPEMSAPGITEALCRTIEAGQHDFILCNYANADMVGHTGVLPAVIKAVETVDRCLERVLASADKAGSSVLITADHGNCEMMIDPVTGGVHTAHTTNPVPFVAVEAGARALRAGGSLRDVAPDGAAPAGHRAARGNDRKGPEGLRLRKLSAVRRARPAHGLPFSRAAAQRPGRPRTERLALSRHLQGPHRHGDRRLHRGRRRAASGSGRTTARSTVSATTSAPRAPPSSGSRSRRATWSG